MNDGLSPLSILNTLLLLGILVTTSAATCSNDRVETQVLRMIKKLETGEFATSGGGGGSGGNGSANGGAAGSTRTAWASGDATDVVVTGWNGMRAPILKVEGADPRGIMRLRDKPQPQQDAYVNRRGSAPRTLNYYATSEGETSTITGYILGRLIGVDPDNPPQLLPALAMSWDVSDDKLTYTYRLRRGVQFADGRPFTSADVKFTFDTLRDPGVRSDSKRVQFEDVESLKTPDAHTVVVRYKQKFWKGLFTVGYTLRMLNKGWYEDQISVWAKKVDIEDFSTQPGKPGFAEVFNKIRIPCPGTGPYYLRSEEDATKEYVKLTANPFYYGIQVHPERYNMRDLMWVFIADKVTAWEAFRKQQFDVSVVDSDTWEDQLSKDETITSIANYYSYDHTGLDCSYIAWNCRQAPFDDARVRTAMTHLTNRQWILDEIERGLGTIAVCKSKRSYPTYSNELEPHPFDLDKARALLAEAGWSDTDGDGVLDKDGKPFSFVFKVPSGRQFYIRVGGVLKDACEQVGIRMTTEPIEWSTFIEDLNNHRFDALCLYSSWSDSWIDHYENYHSSQDRKDGNNISGWRSNEVDAILEAHKEEFDADKRIVLFHRFNKLFYDAQPETLLIHSKVSVVANKRFENMKVRPTGLQFFDWWVKDKNVLHK